MSEDAKDRTRQDRTNEDRTREDRANGDRTNEARNPKTDPATDAESGNAIKDPEDWVTGDERPTEAQLSYLHTLAEEAGEEVPEGLTKAEASERIDALKERTGRGG